MKNILSKIFSFNKTKVELFNIIILIIGLAFGAFFIKFISSSDQNIVVDQITTFFNNCNDNLIVGKDIIKNSLTSNLIFILLIWILGISIIGIPIIIFLVFFKGFTIGFSLGAILFKYGIKGLFPAFLYIFPHQIILIILILLISNYALYLSINLFGAIIKRRNINFKLFIDKYLVVIGISILIIIICSFYECFVMPKFIKLLAKLFI